MGDETAIALNLSHLHSRSLRDVKLVHPANCDWHCNYKSIPLLRYCRCRTLFEQVQRVVVMCFGCNALDLANYQRFDDP